MVHVHDTTTAMVAVNTLYDVGARDESAHLTGMAHLFEHLMFSGTPDVPDFDAPLSAAGGMSNAWTSNDYTNFYDVLPAVNIETALWLESGRMRGLAFSEKGLQVQKSVVIEEFKQVCLNQPYGDSDHALRRLAYTVHPYRYPVIGKEFSHIEQVTPDDERRWFYSHYAPNNAVLAKRINSAVFPGTQGGPLEHVIAAKAVCFGEALKPEFKEYARKIVENAQALAAALQERGVKLVSGGTDNHLMLIDLRDEECTGKDLEARLDSVHITANKNTVPGETRSPFVTSGVRLGTPAVTTRGMGVAEMKVIADCIADCIWHYDEKKDEISERVLKLTRDFPLYE